MKHIDIIKLYHDKSCLIVDDQPTIRTSLKEMMIAFGIETVDTAATSEQAIELCERRSYDLLLCDYNLGEGQDGQQVLEELRYRKLLRNSSMFIMVTAERARDMVLGALEFQPDDYLSKPVTQSLLQKRLTRFILRHEDLLPIKRAIDNQNHSQALEICQQKIDNQEKYQGSYLKTKGELLLEMGLFEAAESFYRECMKEREQVWVKLGLGRALLEQNKYPGAESTLKEVISHDERFVEAHDMLSALYEKNGELDKAQHAMEDAARISPKSVVRQRHLANLAHKNNNLKLSLRAHRAALKVGEHSCRYSPQDYYDVIDGLMEAPADNANERAKNIQNSEMYLRRVEKKHPGDPAIKMQTAASRARLLLSQGKVDEAQKFLEQAMDLYEHGSSSAYAEIELAQTLIKNEEEPLATEILVKTAQANPDDSDISDRVDRLGEEPISKQGRKLAADINKKGIGLFDEGHFDESIETFIRASNLFPRYIGLHLNIAQTALEKLKQEPEDQHAKDVIAMRLETCQGMKQSNKHFPRYLHLIETSLKRKIPLESLYQLEKEKQEEPE
ncbi:MAG: response regulator [Candidatus Pelagadaptatus aseana]|uniref:response regulator n=1 Tax=Candidatus Pelagadaptatus aseana TaxID=3120508 RepID=UPI0039B1EAE1